MKIEFRDSAESITLQDFEGLKKLIGAPVPEDFKELYLYNNGGTPKKNSYYDRLGDYMCVYLYPLVGDEDAPYLTVESAWKLEFGFPQAVSEIPIKCIPFAAEDASGDPIFYSLDGENYGSIFLHRHDTAFEKIEFLAPSLNTFLSSLRIASRESEEFTSGNLWAF